MSWLPKIYLIFLICDFVYFVNCAINCDSANSKSYNQKLLKETNYYRSLHSANPLTLDNGLISQATKWARHLAESGVMKHDRGNFGENLYMSSGKKATPVKSWYDEVKDYDYSANPPSGTGHFTQLVWKSSTKMGCATCTADGRTSYVVCRYLPPGNYIGEYTKNVMRPKGKPTPSQTEGEGEGNEDAGGTQDGGDNTTTEQNNGTTEDGENAGTGQPNDHPNDKQNDAADDTATEDFLNTARSIIKFILFATLIVAVLPIALLVYILTR